MICFICKEERLCVYKHIIKAKGVEVVARYFCEDCFIKPKRMRSGVMLK